VKQLETIVEDPIIQLLLAVIVFYGVMDTFRFILMWVWRKLGGSDDDPGW